MLQMCNARLWSIYWNRLCSISNCSANRKLNAEWGFKKHQWYQIEIICVWSACSFRRQSFVFTTWDEFKGLTKLAIILENDLFDKIESVASGMELTFSRSDKSHQISWNWVTFPNFYLGVMFWVFYLKS